MKNQTRAILAAASMLAAAGVAHADLGDSLFAQGGPVSVTILNSDAGYTSDLYLTSPVGPVLIGSNRDTGMHVNLGSFALGQELIFKLHVRDTGDEFFTGPAMRNADGIAHATVTVIDSETVHVGFEDIYGGGDHDFNDCTFEFKGLSVPAPGPVALAGAGLLGLVRRRRA